MMVQRNSLVLLLATAVLTARGADTESKKTANTEGKKVYECKFMQSPPHGVLAWSQSDRVKNGEGKESRFVPYNSKAAQGLWLDATTTRDVDVPDDEKGRETSFYMAYDAKGWYTYIQCKEPELEDLISRGKDVSLEIFFCPGLEKVPYYQMIVRQLARSVQYYDWAMPHKGYRSLKSAVTVESMPIDGGIATFLFVPWEVLYDRLPLNDDYWRFSLMRWGGKSVTWGGKVHDTGNFGLVRFQKPTDAQRTAIEKGILKSAKLKFLRASQNLETVWGDKETGDPVFFELALKPLIEKTKALNETTAPATRIARWMEFRYEVSELRTDYLMNKYVP